VTSVNSIQLETSLGSVRPYAAELGVADFNAELTDGQLVLLYAARELEKFHLEAKQVLGIMHWAGGFAAKIDPRRAKPPEAITINDNRWVISTVRGASVYDLGNPGSELPLEQFVAAAPDPVTSVAISLRGIFARYIVPREETTAQHR